MYVCIYIYIYEAQEKGGSACAAERQAVARAFAPSQQTARVSRKGTNGFSTYGVTANFMFFDRGTLWVLPLAYFYFPKSAMAYLLPQSVKIPYFCSGPISVDPIRPQPSLPHETHKCSFRCHDKMIRSPSFNLQSSW